MRFNIKTILAKKGLIVTVIIILIAAFLRLYFLPQFLTFLGDQGRDAIIVRRILTLKHLPAIGAPSSIGQIYLGPFYYYLIAPFLLLFNYNPAGLAYGVAMISLAGLIFAYLIVKKTINKFAAFLFLIFLTFSSVNIMLSRYSWNPNLLPIFSFLTLYFFYKLEKTNKVIYAILLGSFFAFSIQLHYLAISLVFPILLFVISKRSTFKTKFSNYLISSICFLFFSIPLLIFDLRHDFLNTRGFIKLFSSHELVGKDSIIDRFASTNQSFFNYVTGLNLNALITILLLFLIIFFFWKNYKKNNEFLNLNFINLVSFLVFFSLLNSARHPHYYGVIYYSLYVVVAFIITRNEKKSLIKYFLIPLFLVFYIAINYQGYYFLKGKPTNQITVAKTIAQSIIDQHPLLPYQFISLPSTDTTGHVRYFLELSSSVPLEEDSPAQPVELYILCYSPSCQVLGNAQWQIAAFKNKKLAKIWEVEGIKIYKLIHE